MAKPSSKHIDVYSRALDILYGEVVQRIPRQHIQIKGAYVLSKYVRDAGVVGVERMTTDVDFDYQTGLDIGGLVDALSVELPARYPNIFTDVLKVRKDPVKGTYGIVLAIADPLGGGARLQVKADFSNKEVGEHIATLGDMLADKLSTNMTRTLLRRSKDAYDLEILLRVLRTYSPVRMSDVVQELSRKGRKVDLSEAVYFTEEGISKLQHAMTVYKPHPVTDMEIQKIISRNAAFLSGLRYSGTHGASVWVGDKWVS